jgi:hypothetical protein
MTDNGQFAAMHHRRARKLRFRPSSVYHPLITRLLLSVPIKLRIQGRTESHIMSSDSGTEERNNGIGRLSQIGNRTSLLALEATLRALPRDGSEYATAAAEVRGIARRVLNASRDFLASAKERT